MEDATIQWKGKRMIVKDLSDNDAIFYFRFRKKHLQEILGTIWPRMKDYFGETRDRGGIVFDKGRYCCPYEALLLMVLFRFSRPWRVRKEMEAFFGIRQSKISAAVHAMVDALHSLVVRYLDDPRIFHFRMQYCAECIQRKCGLAATTWGFIDGTLRKTCCPSYFQKLPYSGQKRSHGIKFQSIVTPDGLFACIFGLITGNRHDSFLLAKSLLLQILRAFMPCAAGPDDHDDLHRLTFDHLEDGVIFSLCGDPAYPQLSCVHGYRNPPPGSPQAAWNTQMSHFCKVVEWELANIRSNWSFLDFRAAKMEFKSPVAKYLVIAACLVNFRSYFYGNQTMEYFNCKTMSLDQYLSLIF